MKKRNLFFGLVCLGALMLSACGGKGSNTNDKGSSQTTPTSTSETNPSSEGTSSSSEDSGSSDITSSSEPEHVHNYEFSSFIWTKTPGAYTAVARYVCAADDEYQDHDATVTKTSTTAAECEADGQIVWHAEYDGHEDNQYETLNALGHDWGEPTWNWVGLAGSKAIATFTCSRNAEHTHEEVATQEDGSIVLHEHVDETCTIDGHDIYRATVTFNGHTYTDDRLETIPATEHSDVDEHGFCEGCGQYQGKELDDPDMNTEFASLTAGAYFYRFAINNEAVYKKVVHNIPASELLLFGLRSDVWEEIVLKTGSYSEIEDTDDGYAYVVLNITATVGNAYFRFDMDCIHNAHLEDHVDQYGFCDICEEYTGLEISASQWNAEVAVPDTDSGETLFIRIEIDDLQHFTLKGNEAWEQALEDELYYLRTEQGVMTQIQVSEFVGLSSLALTARLNSRYYFNLGGRPSDGYLYLVYVVGGQDTVIGETLTVITQDYMNPETGFCYAGEYMGETIEIGEVVTVPNLAKNERAYYRFEDPGDYRLKRVYSSPMQSGDMEFFRMDEEGQFEHISMDVTFREHEASADGYYYCVIIAQATFGGTAQLRIDVEQVTFTVAFYAKFVSDENIAALTEGLEDTFDPKYVNLVFVTLGTSGTNVGAFAGLVNTYNGEHADAKIDIFLGCNGDSGDALKNAGYQKINETSYSYGTDAKRKLWCQIGATEDQRVLQVQAYLAENWAVAA